jgi:hypothetical protein
LKSTEIFNWAGLILLIISCILLSLTQVRGAFKHGLYSSIGKDLDAKSMKLVKFSGLLFLAALLLFITGNLFF